jgi:2-pyrone-4,6-dicarboxylate lactonase
VLDALTKFPQRLRGVAITDTRIKPEVLRDWHACGMRGLRFHLFPQQPNYIRGVGLDVFEVFRKTMAELGWVVQFFCDHRMLASTAAALREIACDMTVIIDHLGMVPAVHGVGDANFQALLKLVGDGHTYVKLSAIYRLSTQFPDYPDARPLHDALIAANPERLMWAATGRIPRLRPNSCRTTAICSICFTPGRRTNSYAGAFWSTHRRGCSERWAATNPGNYLEN